MTNLTYDKIKESYAAKGYVFYDVGNFNINIGFIRHDGATPDVFFVAYRDLFIKRVTTSTAQTRTRLVGSLFSPEILHGVTSHEEIPVGQYKDAWKFIDPILPWLQKPYFKQTTDIDGVAGFNIYFANMIGVINGILHGIEAGCMGIFGGNNSRILFILRECIKTYGNTFNLTILNASDVYP